jgi:protein-disulfide isomerase
VIQKRIGLPLLLCTVIVVLLATACKNTLPQGASQSPHQTSSAVAARVGDRVITVGEVDAKWRELNAAEQLKAQNNLYTGRRAALDIIIGDMVLTRAAAAKGVTLEQYLREEIPRRAKAVTPADVEAFYSANKGEIGDRSIDDVRPAIVQMLERSRRDEAREALLASLRKDAGPTEIGLEPPRQDVAVEPSDPMRGPKSAPVTIVEFSDYQCPFCARATPVLARVRATYGDRVRIVWKDFPLDEIHPRANELAQAARCAGDQDKYWEFHDRVFSAQDAAAGTPLEDYAKAVGITPSQFVECVKSKRHAKAVTGGQDAGNTLGVEATPTFFINGRLVSGAQPYDVFARIIDDELSRRQ